PGRLSHRHSLVLQVRYGLDTGAFAGDDLQRRDGEGPDHLEILYSPVLECAGSGTSLEGGRIHGPPEHRYALGDITDVCGRTTGSRRYRNVRQARVQLGCHLRPQD